LLADYTTATGSFAPDPAMLPPDNFPRALYDAWGPQWAFAGYLSALALGALRQGSDFWHVLHNVSFWLHFLIVAFLLFLVPFTRFFHVIMSPVIVAYNTVLEGGAPRSSGRDAGELPQSPGHMAPSTQGGQGRPAT
jgi:hypothetical protein